MTAKGSREARPATIREPIDDPVYREAARTVLPHRAFSSPLVSVV
jgi:hypothetical protein